MNLYATVGSRQLERAMAFYGALLGSIGWDKIFDNENGGCFYGDVHNGMFAVLAPCDGNPATAGNGTMIGFAVKSPAEVNMFHAKALELGGSDEGTPGFRGPESVGAYFAYFRDLDGNKLCAFHWAPKKNS